MSQDPKFSDLVDFSAETPRQKEIIRKAAKQLGFSIEFSNRMQANFKGATFDIGTKRLRWNNYDFTWKTIPISVEQVIAEVIAVKLSL